ncbi:MAG: universal stress protein [Desulfomonilia bacterium]|nr:universal stress protein [Desulfomonilia bacterium]
MLPITQILVPTDFSECSIKALETAQEFAVHFSAEVTVLHVIPPASSLVYETPSTSIDPVILTKELEDASRKNLTDLCVKTLSPDVRYHALIAHGDPAGKIADTARENGVNMIVISTHGESGWRHMLFGSVTEKVVRTADTPVLTVQPDHD